MIKAILFAVTVSIATPIHAEAFKTPGDPAVSNLIRQIILGAYALPVMMTDINKKSVSTEYAAKVALMCYNAK